MRMKLGMLFLVIILSVAFARPTLIILDASGSMEDYMDSGMTKIEAAKIAAKELVNNANDQIALMVYTDCDDGEDPNNGAIRVVVDFTTNKQLLISNIDTITPYGGTPIANSIKEGATFVGSKGNDAGIVLLTDGEETCNELDPVEISELADENGVSIINIVGFQLDSYSQAEISEVAQATGGSYYDAENLETLKESMQEAYSSASGERESALEGLNLVCCSAPAAFVLAGVFAFSNNRKKKK